MGVSVEICETMGWLNTVWRGAAYWECTSWSLSQWDRRLIPMHQINQTQSGGTYLSECGYPICNYMYHTPLGSFSLDQDRFLPGCLLSFGQQQQSIVFLPDRSSSNLLAARGRVLVDKASPQHRERSLLVCLFVLVGPTTIRSELGGSQPGTIPQYS